MRAPLVPDASVILKWVLPPQEEPFAAEAQALLDAFVAGEVPLLVPGLWYYEVGNTLTRRFPAEAAEMLSALRGLALPEAEASPDLEETAVRLVVGNGITFYDAIYHALAIVTGGTFVTADQRYYERTHEAGSIAMLGDWPSG